MSPVSRGEGTNFLISRVRPRAEVRRLNGPRPHGSRAKRCLVDWPHQGFQHTRGNRVDIGGNYFYRDFFGSKLLWPCLSDALAGADGSFYLPSIGWGVAWKPGGFTPPRRCFVKRVNHIKSFFFVAAHEFTRDARTKNTFFSLVTRTYIDRCAHAPIHTHSRTKLLRHSQHTYLSIDNTHQTLKFPEHINKNCTYASHL